MRRLQATVRLGLGLAVCLYAAPAQASIFGEENVSLMGILAESLQQTVSMKQTLDYIRETTGLARDTAGFAREAIQTSRNLRTILANPESFAAQTTQAWASLFPEAQDILANINDTRESIHSTVDSEGFVSYDPYAYVRAFDRLRFATDDGFEVMAHQMDLWGINTPHDAMLTSLGRQHDIAVDNLERLAEAINYSQLSPLQASVYTAQSSAVSATAQVEAAATLQHIARTQELQAMREAEAANQVNEAYKKEMGVVLQPSVPFMLDPMGRRTPPPHNRTLQQGQRR